MKKKTTKKRGSKILRFPMKIGGILLAEFRASMAEYKEVEIRWALHCAKVKAEIQKAKYKPLRDLINDRDLTEKERDERGVDLQTIVRRIAERFKIPINKMREYAINDKTGVITYDPVKKTSKSQGQTKKTGRRRNG